MNTKHQQIIWNLETICGCTSAARAAANALRELVRNTEPLTAEQRVTIAETAQHLDFQDDFLNSIATVVKLVEEAHGITE